jgi:hypothetical protein
MNTLNNAAAIETIINLAGDTYKLFKVGTGYMTVIRTEEHKHNRVVVAAATAVETFKSIKAAKADTNRNRFGGCMVGGLGDISAEALAAWNTPPAGYVLASSK